MESQLQLKGWSRARRVILVREAPAVAPVGAGKRRRRDHFEPPLAEGEGWDAQPHPWSGRTAVLVTSEEAEGGFATAATARHYRERADAEPERSGDSQLLSFKTAGITSLTKPKTNGDGVDIPPGKSPLAASWPPSSP